MSLCMEQSLQRSTDSYHARVHVALWLFVLLQPVAALRALSLPQPLVGVLNAPEGRKSSQARADDS